MALSQTFESIPYSGQLHLHSRSALFSVYKCFSVLGLESGGPFIEQVLVLQNYAEGWTDGKWEEKVDERPCIERLMYSKDKQGYFR